ncbi:unnamed protein product, partial [Mesorhabditis belari]|uniref:Translocon-associated protein subunit alpha n=1 Tax=Mesorhabditis belari TaxID=2138241 RepID=A0AAF3ET85_9BILA
MIGRRLLVLTLGLLALGFVHCEDAADGEIVDEGAPVTAPIDEEVGGIGPSSDAALSFLFTQPSSANVNRELVAGKLVKYLIGFQNRGEKDFIVKFSESSFRYHQDFNYHIQNFTLGQYNRRVAPKEEATLDYGLFVADQFAGRPLGLVVNVHYEDSEGRYFVSTVFNETVSVLEDDSGFNHETYFLYLVFAGLLAGAFFLGQHYLNKLTRKAGMTKKRSAPVETGTSGRSEVDFEWIPRDVIKASEKKSPKPVSPRQRKAQKAE